MFNPTLKYEQKRARKEIERSLKLLLCLKKVYLKKNKINWCISIFNVNKLTV